MNPIAVEIYCTPERIEVYKKLAWKSILLWQVDMDDADELKRLINKGDEVVLIHVDLEFRSQQEMESFASIFPPAECDSFQSFKNARAAFNLYVTMRRMSR